VDWGDRIALDLKLAITSSTMPAVRTRRMLEDPS
jgi:hypothetical protein